MSSKGLKSLLVKPQLHYRLKLHSVETGKPVGTIVEAALEEYLARQETKPSTKRAGK